MKFSLSTAALALAGAASAQRPSNTSICDYYTTALLKDNTPANQYKLLTLLVNTAVIGNYTMPNVGVAVTGILNPGNYMGANVNLLPYFDGGLASSNRGGQAAVVNFLDGGGAAPLKQNMPAMDTTSNQYKLLTHLYQYFGGVLMCSGYGQMGFPAYAGQGSQAQVHRFMDLNSNQVGYFIQQVGMSAASFGVSQADVQAAGQALTKLFDYRCSPPMTVIPAQGAQLQSICQDMSCQMDPNATCSAYPNGGVVMQPAVANASLAMGEGNSSAPMANSTSSGSGSMSSGSSSSGSTPSSGSSSSPSQSAMSASGAAAGALPYGVAALGGLALAMAL